jgi:hypothetical protein
MHNLARFSTLSAIVLTGVSLSILGGTSAARADSPAFCSSHLKQRTAEETIREHLALMEQGKLDQAMCDYADNAAVVLPGQIITGLANIRAGLANVGTLLGGSLPVVQTLTATSSVVMITFTASGTPCTIPDGSDTYIVDKGHIVTQIVHDTFHSAPNAVCPVAAPVP